MSAPARYGLRDDAALGFRDADGFPFGLVIGRIFGEVVIIAQCRLAPVGMMRPLAVISGVHPTGLVSRCGAGSISGRIMPTRPVACVLICSASLWVPLRHSASLTKAGSIVPAASLTRVPSGILIPRNHSPALVWVAAMAWPIISQRVSSRQQLACLAQPSMRRSCVRNLW